ncbi:MAG TPA: tRNA (adenosine(37)-N6)-threonylcarbamoyltransferase complex dimerization subunit type 1 TsaB [Vicinamibacteria bacterium]
MRVLAVDTTSPRASVALSGASGILGEGRSVSEAGHSRWVLPAIEALLRDQGLEAGALDLFAVTTGPGSFTGLRVGLGTVQGLALASRKPCLGVPTLDVLAHAAAGAAATLVALMDAFRGEVFSAVYDGEARLVGEHRVGKLEDVLQGLPRGSAFVGDAAVAQRAAIEAAVEGAVFPETSAFLAAPLALLALRAERPTVAASELRPLYLRAAAVWPTRT